MRKYLFDCGGFPSAHDEARRAKTMGWAAFVDEMKDTRLTLHRDGRKSARHIPRDRVTLCASVGRSDSLELLKF